MEDIQRAVVYALSSIQSALLVVGRQSSSITEKNDLLNLVHLYSYFIEQIWAGDLDNIPRQTEVRWADIADLL